MTFDSQQTPSPPPPAAGQPLRSMSSQSILQSPSQSLPTMNPALPPSVERAVAAQVLMVHENALLQQIPKVTDSGRQTIGHVKYMVTLVDKVLTIARDRHAKVKDEEAQLAAHIDECKSAKVQYGRYLDLLQNGMKDHESFVKTHEVSRAKIRSQALANETTTLENADLPHKTPTPAAATISPSSKAKNLDTKLQSAKKTPRSVPRSPSQPVQSTVIPATAPDPDVDKAVRSPEKLIAALVSGPKTRDVHVATDTKTMKDIPNPAPSPTDAVTSKKKQHKKLRKTSKLPSQGSQVSQPSQPSQVSQPSQAPSSTAVVNPFLSM